MQPLRMSVGGRPFIVLLQVLLALSWLAPALSQDFSIPGDWRKPTSNLTRAERAKYANDAVAQVISFIDPSKGDIPGFENGQAASLVAVLANQDLYNGNKTHMDTATTNLQVFERAHPNFYSTSPRISSDATFWGMAAYYCYRAYGDQFLLDIATSVWSDTTQFVVTDADAKNGSHPTKDVKIPSTCPNGTTAGAVFWDQGTANDTNVNGESVGPYMALSAYLYEATNDTKYLDAAARTGKFIQNQLWDGIFVHDTIVLAQCDVIGNFYSYNTGYFIEGLAVLANVTQDGGWASLLEDVVPKTIKYRQLIGANGVVFEEAQDVDKWASGLKTVLVRAFHEAWARSNKTSSMATLIEAFLTVQMNAVLDLATVPGSNNYTTSWSGPAPTTLHPAGNIAAADVFNAAFDIVASSMTNTTSSTSPTNGSDSDNSSSGSKSGSSSNAGAIVGGIVGGLAGLILTVGGIIFWRRRRVAFGPVYFAGDEMARHPSSSNPEYTVEPFPANTVPSRHVPMASGAVAEKNRIQSSLDQAGTATPGPSTVVSMSSTPSASQHVWHESLQATSYDMYPSRAASSGGYVPVHQQDAVGYEPDNGGVAMSELPQLVPQLAGLLHLHSQTREAPPEYHQGGM